MAPLQRVGINEIIDLMIDWDARNILHSLIFNIGNAIYVPGSNQRQVIYDDDMTMLCETFCADDLKRELDGIGSKLSKKEQITAGMDADVEDEKDEVEENEKIPYEWDLYHEALANISPNPTLTYLRYLRRKKYLEHLRPVLYSSCRAGLQISHEPFSKSSREAEQVTSSAIFIPAMMAIGPILGDLH